jgi:hypothetical protein
MFSVTCQVFAMLWGLSKIDHCEISVQTRSLPHSHEVILIRLVYLNKERQRATRKLIKLSDSFQLSAKMCTT